jgi:hypothetical protein
MRIMYDSVTIASIPLTGAEMIGCYADGTYENVTAAAQRFPDKQIVTIDTRGTDPKARVLDYEPGDVQSPASAIAWVHASKAAGNDYPTIYADRYDMAALIPDLAAAGLVVGKDVYLWVATLDGTWQQYQGALGIVAVQYKDEGGYDISVVLNDRWIPAPVPPVAPLTIQGMRQSAYTEVAAVNLAWDAVPGHAGDYEWQIERYSVVTREWALTDQGSTAVTFASQGNLAHDGSYRWRVSAGIWSDWSLFTTP